MAATRVILALNPGMNSNDWQQSLTAAGLDVTTICSHGADVLQRLNAGEADALLAGDLLPGLIWLQAYQGPAKIVILALASPSLEPDWRAWIGADRILPVKMTYAEVAANIHSLLGQTEKTIIPNRLTDSEPQVLCLLAEGLTDEEIGLRLGVGGNALQKLLDVMMIKLGASSRLEMMVSARRWHLNS